MFRRSILIAAALGVTALVPFGAPLSARPVVATAPIYHPTTGPAIPHPGTPIPGLHGAATPLPASKLGPFVKPRLVTAKPGFVPLGHSVLHPAPKETPPKTTQHDPDMKGHWSRPGGIITAIDPVVVETPSVAAPASGIVTAVGGGRTPTSLATPGAAEPCNCLTKQYLDDGSVLFRDICTKEAAIASPVDLKRQAQGAQ